MDAIQVLLYIRGYIQNFFGCRECSQNFMRGAIHIEERVHSNDDAVTFLWRSHNKANWNLHGDTTEDPEHPKVQFPSVAQCPDCHAISDNGTDFWNDPEVAKFLRRMYAAENIVDDSIARVATNTTRGPDREGDRGFTSILKSLARQHDRFDSILSLTRLDINLCFAFYVVCAFVLVALYLRFCRRCKLAHVISRVHSNIVWASLFDASYTVNIYAKSATK